MTDYQNDDLEGLLLKENGMILAAEAQDREDKTWREKLLDLLRELARQLQYLDSDDLYAAGVPKPAHSNAMGSIWKEAIARGWIVETLEEPRRRSRRPEAHGAKMTRYKSLIWEGQ